MVLPQKCWDYDEYKNKIIQRVKIAYEKQRLLLGRQQSKARPANRLFIA